MGQWRRTTDMMADVTALLTQERWSLVENGSEIVGYDVDVTRHKPVDMRKLKLESLDDLRAYSHNLSQTAAKMYGGAEGQKVRLASCPCCNNAPAEAPCISIFGVPYVRCVQCGHAYVQNQPNKNVLEEEFTDSEELSATYVDKKACEERLQQVVAPKLQWMQKEYQKSIGRTVSSIVDVGAGGGHFLEMAQRSGMSVQGYELSAASRNFAKSAFGISLSNEDFLNIPSPATPVDCVSFWGLLEYAPDPSAFLQAAKRWLHPQQGMVVLEVPRYDCLGTAILEQFPDTVYRHMEPTSHIHCFSDASVNSMLLNTGFEPIAAWYFGMDVYELLTQISIATNDATFMDRFAHLIPPLQKILDLHRCCDDMIIAAKIR